MKQQKKHPSESRAASTLKPELLKQTLGRLYPNDDIIEIIFTVGAVLAVLCAMWMFTGNWYFKAQPYNSYILQAKAWLNGNLHLADGAKYSYLELAIYDGKYFVSFPPFPSYLMLPFVALGNDKCDGLISLISCLTGVVYAMRIMHKCGKHGSTAVLLTLLLTIGSNWLFIVHNAWVWFIAQNLAFTFSLMAIYYAMCGKAGRALAFWACAVGCRPFQTIYAPVLLYLLYIKYKADGLKPIEMIRAKWYYTIPMIIIAISYMWLNHARFGNIIEFGHNYLPEFTRTTTGQFNKVYMEENIKNLFRLPEYTEQTGRFKFQAANGFNIFMVSPIFLVFIAAFLYGIVNFKKKDYRLLIGIFILAVIHLIAITAHKTMGGSHFGNRYPCDTLPFLFAAIGIALPDKSRYISVCLIPLMFGFALNVLGTISYFVK